MTEDVLDQIRPLLATAAEEAGRGQRAAKGSSAHEETVREHTTNAATALRAVLAILDPPAAKPAPVFEPPFVDMTERAVMPAPPARRKLR